MGERIKRHPVGERIKLHPVGEGARTIWPFDPVGLGAYPVGLPSGAICTQWVRETGTQWVLLGLCDKVSFPACEAKDNTILKQHLFSGILKTDP